MMSNSPNKSFPWFKVYGEILSDRKITRICAMTKQPKFAVWGIWTGLLAIASQSPERGKLLISEGLPLTLPEIAFEIGMDDETCRILIEAFRVNNMLCLEGDCYSIVHWDDRQSSRDDSKERVRKYREKREALGLSVAPRYDSAAILERDESQCVYCGSDRNLCVDHIYPIEQGGTDHDDNLAAACKACSGGKAGRTPEQAAYKFVNLEAQKRYLSYLNNVMGIRNSVTVTGNGNVTSVTPLESEEDKESTTNAADEIETILRREVVSIWENNINVGGPGSILTTMIVDVLGDIPGNTDLKLKWFKEAVGRAKGAGAPNWNYIKAILVSWIAKGEIDDVLREDLPRRRPGKPGGSYQPKKESLIIPEPPDPIPPPVLAEHVAIWETAKSQVRNQMTGATFDTLFKDAQPIERENGTFELRVKPSALEMIEHRPKVKANILAALQAVKPEIHSIDFEELKL